MHTSEFLNLHSNYHLYKEEQLFGRWITLNHIEKIFPKYEGDLIRRKKIGESEQGKPIYMFTIGNGSKKILLWSQMHGNESTGTKSIFDLLNFFHEESPIASHILAECKIHIIPILNPDGAEIYSRLNANKIDLNRDAVKRIAVESQILREALDVIQPDFCFNLHDQRTIFGVSGTGKPATISFLAPSEDRERSLTEGRKKTMNVIAAMNAILQNFIPDQVGRYTDEFYPTATGDNFQKLGYSTILIESGHFPEDYEREIARKYTFLSILSGIQHIAAVSIYDKFDAYFDIPDNSKNFRDLVHRFKNKKDQVFQYEEVLEQKGIKFVPIKVKGDISDFIFHKEIVFVS